MAGVGACRLSRGCGRERGSGLGGDPLGDRVGGAHQRCHARHRSPELASVEVDRATGDDHAIGVLERATRRLAGLRLSLGGDAARVDHVQVGLGLGDLGVAGGQQRVARKGRVGLGDLATEKLDREPSHGSETVPPRRRQQTDGTARRPRAAPSELSCDSRSRPADLRTPQQATQTAVSSRRGSKRGERALGGFRREAWAAARWRQGAGHRLSHQSRVGLATVHLLRLRRVSCSQATRQRMRPGGRPVIGHVSKILVRRVVHDVVTSRIGLGQRLTTMSKTRTRSGARTRARWGL